MELFLDVLGESLVDTAKMLPFLFLAYLFIEYVETRHGERIEALLAGGGKLGFLPGAVLGCVPQCGFSAIASNFYSSKVITLGTLMAVFLATSDEEGHHSPIWMAALRHTLEIFVFIFGFSLVFGLIVEGVGEDVFAAVLGEMGFFQPVVAAAVGLIPNCAARVLLTQLYVEGALRFSSLVAGLCTGAGVGLAVLWRANPSWKQNLFITGLTWACGAFLGVAMQLVVLLAG